VFVRFLVWLRDRLEQWAIDGSDDQYYFDGEKLIKVVIRPTNDYIAYTQFYIWAREEWYNMPDPITKYILDNPLGHKPSTLEDLGFDKIHWKEARRLIQHKL